MPENQKTIAFITGGNRGIGLETARQLGGLGILPVIGARSGAAAKQALDDLAASGVEATSIIFDALNRDDHRRAYEYFSDTLGGLDILINNAGVHLEGEAGVKHLHTASTTPEDVLRKTMETNFFAPVALTSLLLPLLRKAPAGRIVNLSTILASLTLMSNPEAPIAEMKSLAYDTSKVAINSFTIQLAHELRGSTVKVNSAHPGWVKTEMGGSAAQMDIVEGAKTSVALATLPTDGPSGAFLHLGEPLPW